MSSSDSLLEKKLFELRAEIARREAELLSLKEKFKKLDEARAVLVEMTTPAEGALAQVARAVVAEKEIGLQEGVLNYLHASPNPDGAKISEVIEALRKDYLARYNGKNSYSASIYVTLKRLAEQGKIKVADTETGKRWLPINATRNIFETVKS